MQKYIEKPLSLLAKICIRAYQIMLSPILGNNCRFHPNCSSYAIEAIDKHGTIIGLWLLVKRIARCNPWHVGGYDPVPLPSQIKKSQVKTITVASGGVIKNDR